MNTSSRLTAIRRMDYAGVMLLYIVLFAVAVSAQELRGKISGRVLGPDGKAITGARVMLREINHSQSSGTVTDESGHYSFEHIPDGLYSLSATKGGYGSRSFSSENAVESTPLRVEAGAELSKIDLQLGKGGVITGKITEEGGEPVVLASVEAIEVGKSPGSPRDFKQATFLTDDRGVYRIFGLPAGQYLISVHQAHLSGQNQEHVTAYYPGVASQRSASPIEVAAGSEVTSIDFILKRRNSDGGTLSGRITRADGTPLQSAIIYAYKRDSQASRVSAAPRQDGSYEFKHLSSGDYVIEVLTQDQSLVERTRTFALVNSSGAVEKNVTVEPGAEVSGQFVLEDGSRPKQVSGMTVSAWAEDQGYQIAARIQGEGRFRIARLPGGSIRLIARTGTGRYYVVSFFDGETELQEGTLSLRAGAQLQGIRIILSDQGAVLRGAVKQRAGDKPATGSWILLMPIEGTQQEAERLARSARADQRGQFIIEGITPGRFFVLACLDPKLAPTDPSIWKLMAADRPEFVRELDLKAKSQQETSLRVMEY